MATQILVRRGLVASLPTLASGEPGYATDTKTLYIGDGTASPPRILMAGTGVIVNADINASAAIAYSKLNLATSIVNADISTSAAIARSKIAAGTASHVVIHDGSGNLSSEANLAVSRGGTGAGSLTANNVLLGNGTSALQVVAPGTSGNVLTSNGTTWTSAAPAGGGAWSTSLATDDSGRTSTTLSAVMSISGSTISWSASTTYNFECFFICSNAGSATPDLDFQFNGPATSAVSWFWHSLRTTSFIANMAEVTSAFATGGTAGTTVDLASATKQYVFVRGAFTTSGTPGSNNFALEYAQNVGDGVNATIVEAGSYLRLFKNS